MPGMGVGAVTAAAAPAPLVSQGAVSRPESPGACGKTAEADQASFTPACLLSPPPKDSACHLSAGLHPHGGGS